MEPWRQAGGWAAAELLVVHQRVVQPRRSAASTARARCAMQASMHSCAAISWPNICCDGQNGAVLERQVPGVEQWGKQVDGMPSLNAQLGSS
jgi:hypothetical protein